MRTYNSIDKNKAHGFYSISCIAKEAGENIRKVWGWIKKDNLIAEPTIKRGLRYFYNKTQKDQILERIKELKGITAGK